MHSCVFPGTLQAPAQKTIMAKSQVAHEKAPKLVEITQTAHVT